MAALSNIISEIGESLTNIVKGLEQIVNDLIDDNIIKIKKTVTRILIQYVIFIVSLVFIVIGGVLFLSRFFPLDLILLVGGAILLYVSLLLNLKRKK